MAKSADPLAGSKVPAAKRQKSPELAAAEAAELEAKKIADADKRARIHGSRAVPKVPDPAMQPKPPPKFVVQRRVTVSWGSQMVTLYPGKVISDASHGPGAVDKLRNMGVALEPE